MTKILKKDIIRLCNCIQGLSYQHIKENEKGCFYHNIIKWCNIKPYTCKEVKFLFYDDYEIILTADNKKEKHRLNVHKKLLLELNKVIDR